MATDAQFGSDLVVGWLADAGIDHVALNPGATLRGLHDSLVRADRPRPIVTLHEEIAVGIAHGYAKATGRPMAVFVHNLVGLQHASMALFNAWVDRAPMLVLGGSGPRAEDNRRPWLDWIHSGHPQGTLVRDIVKWDAEPATLAGLREALHRGLRFARTEPSGPVYVSVDTDLQEGPAGGRSLPPLPAVEPARLTAPDDVAAEVADVLRQARRPAVVVDMPVRGLAASLLPVVERLAAAVVDLGGGCNYPTTHWADQSHDRRRTLAEADVVLAFEVRDLGWATTETDTGSRATTALVPPDVPVIAVGMSELRHSGFLVPESSVEGARYVLGDAVLFADALSELLVDVPDDRSTDRRTALAARHTEGREADAKKARGVADHSPIHPAHLANAVWDAVHDAPWQLANGHLDGWPRRLWDITADEHFLGRSGGHGLGYGLPASLGAALAHRDDDVLVVDIQADGDLMYTSSSLWTAAHHQIPVLVVMHNNRTYGKDELHQREMAAHRERSDDVVGVGIHLDHPAIDFAALAKAQGVEGIGPIDDHLAVAEALAEAVRIVREERRPFLVDVICASKD
ncbi:MAG: thiamine pyrophosphate-binding protein [Streptosporangiales bacterium]|nr:thiamine pyrophosphate-binding protein [Streptosporangiales bacterium]